MTRYQNNITLPDFYDSQVEEKKILKFWCKQKIFEKIRTARREKNDGKLSFYSGPVFPTGYPHSGHILNGIVKDVFTRYGHQKNLEVESRFGWDCHGLAVEHEVDKKLGIRSAGDVQRMGIATYNEECRKFVQQHTTNWKKVPEVTGNWLDFTEQYETMSTEYMESVWWVFKQLYDKGLVYKETKVLPYSTACFTHVSNFEAEQNCKDVAEVGMTISVNIVHSDEKLLIWTTTPWALVSNLAICVNPKAVYLRVKAGDVIYILSKNSLKLMFANPSEYTVLEEFLGETLQSLQYEPLFDRIPVSRDFRILLDGSLSDDVGTGIVPLDEALIESLNERGHILKVGEVKYKRPHCWRSDTPLIKKQVESWFIRVKALTEELLKNNSQINWFPDNKDCFKNWLKDHSTNWAVSRTRYWGTPIPIWSSPSGDEVVCVGSIEELKRLTGKTNITDLHRECVDWTVIPSKTPGNPPLRRVPEVFDCWFESGAMPFAVHRDHLSESFQADFVAEGIDQTRGWYYTMLVLSTALSKPPPFRNVFSTGLVLEPDGSKVSKRKHNRQEPMRLAEKYGSDALRLYLMNSPLVRCEGFTIQQEGVANMAEAIIQPLYRIFYRCTTHCDSPSWTNYGYVTDWGGTNDNIDLWILSCTESLLQFYESEMKVYRIHTVLPRVIELIQQLEDWYLPIRHPELKKTVSYRSPTVLFNVIYRLCLILAPFAPFFTEYIYQIHRPYFNYCYRKESIHEALLLSPDKRMIKLDVEIRVSRMQAVVELVRALRLRYIIPIQYQISEVVVIHHKDDYLHDIELLKEIIMKLLNARDVQVTKNRRAYEFQATLKAELRPSSTFSSNQQMTSAIKDLTDEEIESLIQEDPINILNQSIPLDDIQITYQLKRGQESNYEVVTKDDLIVVMKMNKSFSYYEMGTVIEIESRISNLKKKGNYYSTDRAIVYYSTKDECLQNVMVKRRKHFEDTTNCKVEFEEPNPKAKGEPGRIEETLNIKGLVMRLSLFSNCD